MADTAFQTAYRQEFIFGFEQKQSLLRDTVTTEAVIKGNSAVFLVADSGGAEATSRGTNGLISARPDDLTQNTCTLQEWHDKVHKTGFNIFASQGNQRQIMQETTMGVINRKIDNQIITELNTGTISIGSSTTVPSTLLFQNAIVKLGNASVPWDGNITLVCGPGFLAYLEMATEFASADYIEARPYAGTDASWRDKQMAYRWRNCTIITHPAVPSIGTAGEKAFMYHKSAIGHAADTAGMTSAVGYDDQDDYSYARASIFMGSKLLQNSGIVVITCDTSALS